MPRTLGQAAGFLLGFGLALVVFIGLLALPARGESESALEARLHEAVNQYRAENALIALVRRPDLDAVARGHSLDMARRGYLAHESPEGANWVDRLSRARVEGFAMAAENVGVTSRSRPTAEIVGGWIHSEVHRRNLRMRPFNATGVGVARAADGRLYYTQLYLSFPRAARQP